MSSYQVYVNVDGSSITIVNGVVVERTGPSQEYLKAYREEIANLPVVAVTPAFFDHPPSDYEYGYIKDCRFIFTDKMP